MHIPVMRPRMPGAQRLLPYLQDIDSNGIYSNYGPLTRRLECRLAAHVGLPQGTVTSVANATLGLALALAAQTPVAGSLCILPGWTFVASAHAVVMAGLVPYFVDVDAERWVLDPDRVEDSIAGAPGKITAVMAVAPFGRPIDISAWDRLRSRTGLAVVVDAAASFDNLVPGETPAVVSMHATKVMGIGEGGFVVSKDVALIADIRARANFGFSGSREALHPGVNAKLSEYHAAIGLAALDEWAATRAEWIGVARAYRRSLPKPASPTFQSGFGEEWIASTCVLSLRDIDAENLARCLAAAKIDSRQWWGSGAHAHPATASFPRSSLPVTTELARTTIGVPFYRDLGALGIRRICEVILGVCNQNALKVSAGSGRRRAGTPK